MHEINYYEIEGDARDLGLAHGKAAGDLIASALDGWDEGLRGLTGMGREPFVEKFLAAHDFRRGIEKHTPDLLVEVDAIAEGAEQDPQTIFAWQMVDEWLDYAVESSTVSKCSALGGYDEATGLPPLIGKTQDLPHLYLGHTALIKTKTRTGEFFNSGVVGLVAQDGLNDRGVGVCCNHIGHLQRDPAGVPVAFLLRAVLENAADVEHAISIVESMPSASGMNYVLGDKQKVVDIEVSAHDVVRYSSTQSGKRVWHTNHPLVNAHYSEEIELWSAMPDAEAGNTRARFASLENSLADESIPLGLELAKKTLSSRDGPVSSLPEDAFPTVNGMIIEFYDDPVLHFCVGAPVHGNFQQFSFA